MSKCIALTVAVTSCVLIAVGQTLRTNQLMIGDEVVDGRIINGKIVGDRWMVISNELIRVHAEVAPIAGPSETLTVPSSKNSNSEPSLRLLLSTGVGSPDFARVRGFHGLMYMARDSKKPALAKTEMVDIYSSEDNARIVVMVWDNGPIYSSTNSGMTWIVINQPGEYRFPVGGFIAAATIRPSKEHEGITRSSPSDWYAVASAPDSKLVLTQNALQAAPALSITRSNGAVVVSWPSAFTGYFLQTIGDLSSTNWVDVPDLVNLVGQENQVLMPTPADNVFYRLRSL